MMLDHLDIAQVAVVGMADERLGEVGIAFVVAASGHTVDTGRGRALVPRAHGQLQGAPRGGRRRRVAAEPVGQGDEIRPPRPVRCRPGRGRADPPTHRRPASNADSTYAAGIDDPRSTTGNRPVTAAGQHAPVDDLLEGYGPNGAWDEMFAAVDEPRSHYTALRSALAGLSRGDFEARCAARDHGVPRSGHHVPAVR